MEGGKVWHGILLGLAPHLLLLVLWGALTVLGPSNAEDALVAALFAPGLVQLLWLVPLAIWAGVRRQFRTLAGLCGIGALVLLLNGACFGLVMATLSEGHF